MKNLKLILKNIENKEKEVTTQLYDCVDSDNIDTEKIIKLTSQRQTYKEIKEMINIEIDSLENGIEYFLIIETLTDVIEGLVLPHQICFQAKTKEELYKKVSDYITINYAEIASRNPHSIRIENVYTSCQNYFNNNDFIVSLKYGLNIAEELCNHVWDTTQEIIKLYID